MGRDVFYRGTPGQTVYAKALPLTIPWGDDAVHGVETRSTGSFVFYELHEATSYEVFLQAAGSPAESDEAVAAIDSEDRSNNDRKWSIYRRPSEWRVLLQNAGVSASESTWGRLRTKHSDEIQGEPGNEDKSCRITVHLVISWGLKLPEFED